MPNRVFRLFVSSTFSDFQREREALQAHVFPELERYCLERGARFQAVDLRWGISEEAGRQHSTMKVCLDEIRRTQRLSPRPNFVVLLGEPVRVGATGGGDSRSRVEADVEGGRRRRS